MCIFLIIVPGSYSIETICNLGVLGSFFGSAEGVGPGIGPKWAKRVQNTTKVDIIAIVWGQKSPSSSYSGWSGAYSIETPCMYVCVCVSPSLSLSVCRSVGLSVCRSVGLSVCRSVGLSVCRSVVCRSVSLSGLLVCLSVCLVSVFWEKDYPPEIDFLN